MDELNKGRSDDKCLSLSFEENRIIIVNSKDLPKSLFSNRNFASYGQELQIYVDDVRDDQGNVIYRFRPGWFAISDFEQMTICKKNIEFSHLEDVMSSRFIAEISGFKYLIHSTPCKNLKSILEEGKLLPGQKANHIAEKLDMVFFNLVVRDN